MADNVVLNQGAGGEVIASDDISGVQHQLVKIEYGDDGSATQVSQTNRFPVETTADQAASDAFGLFRVSNPVGLAQFKHTRLVHSTWAIASGSTDASASLDTNRASRTLYLGTTPSDYIVYQSKKYVVYQPGKSLLTIHTGRFASGSANVTQRYGLFDDDNGIFWQVDENGIGVGIRNSVSGSAVDNVVYQSDWNIDVMDGTGPSKVNLNPLKGQIFVMDLQWLGLGRVRWGFSHNGKIRYVHAIEHANRLESVYMSAADLPVRAEIRNGGSSPASPTQMEVICVDIESEGGFNRAGINYSAGTETSSPRSITSGTVPLISIRFQDGVKGFQLSDINTEVASPGTAALWRWKLIHNPTIVGGTAASWQNVGAGSYMEYDTARDGAVEGGHVVATGYGTSDANSQQSSILEVETQMGFGIDINGNKDEFVLVVDKSSGPSADFYGALNWKEVY